MSTPTVTTGPIVGTVPMSPDDDAPTHAVSVTRWSDDGTAHRIELAAWPTATATERDAATVLAAEVRGALADAYHAGRADAERELRTAAAAVLAEMFTELENGTASGRNYIAAERVAHAIGAHR